MKRRTFLQVIFAGGSVAAVPGLKFPASSANMLGHINETIIWSVARSSYFVTHYVFDKSTNKEHYFCDYMDNLEDLSQCREYALMAFNRRFAA